MRHILVAEKKGDAVDFAKSKAEADRIYAELKNGGDFAAIAKESSADTQSTADGGKLTISRGQTVPEFDKVAFELKEGASRSPSRRVRLPPDRGALAGPQGDGDAARQGSGVDSHTALAAEAGPRS